MMNKLYVVMKAGDILDWFVDDVEAGEYARANDASVFVFENTSWPHRAEEKTPCWNDAPAPDEPIPTILHCPECKALHVDEGEWATRPHKTHQCQKCGHEWRPYSVPTVGIHAPDGREIAIYRQALEEIAPHPFSRVGELGYSACRRIASAALKQGDRLRAGKG